jgi:hypothetical protein
MTFVEFIKSQFSDKSELGVLARDIQGNLKFPVDKS